MRHHPDQVGICVNIGAAARASSCCRGGQAGHQHEDDLVDQDEAESPLCELECLAESSSPQIEARPEPESHLPHERDQHQRLGGDTGGGAETEQQRLLIGEGPRVVSAGSPGHQVESEHREPNDVVGDRGPHHGTELVPCIEHLPQDRVDAVEEDLRESAVGQRHHRGVLSLQVSGAVGV